VGTRGKKGTTVSQKKKNERYHSLHAAGKEGKPRLCFSPQGGEKRGWKGGGLEPCNLLGKKGKKIKKKRNVLPIQKKKKHRKAEKKKGIPPSHPAQEKRSLLPWRGGEKRGKEGQTLGKKRENGK